MSRKSIVAISLIAFCGLMLFAGCGDDNTTAVGDTTPLELIDIAEIIENVAPPEFSAPTGSPSAVDSAWLYGEYPLLEKVFGSENPPTLYRNINDFKMFMDIVEMIVRVDADGNFVEDTYTDTTTEDIGGTPTLLHYSATVTALDAATDIPAAAQAVLGETIDVDYLIAITLEELPEGLVHIGVKISETEQTILLYDANMGGESDDPESSVKYLSLDPSDSTFVFKGTGYCADADENIYSYAFDITSDANSDFSYRMSWYSNDIPDSDLLGCILGGGNKDTEFALMYRQYVPADSAVMDSTFMYDAVFGPDYSDSEGLITDYADYLDEELIFGYDVMPQAMLTTPWEEY